MEIVDNKKMPYWLFILLCYISKPFRWLVPKYSDFDFALTLLFPNRYKRAFVWCQSYHETGGFKSELCKDWNNYFGMAFIDTAKLSFKYNDYDKYQDGQVINSAIKGKEPTKAAYDNVYRSVYDYYDCVYRRVKNYGHTLVNELPTHETFNETSVYQYITAVLEKYKAIGYFGALLSVYTNGSKSAYKYYTAKYWRFVLNLVYVFCLPTTICVLIYKLFN